MTGLPAGLVILSSADTDAPTLPAIATVSKFGPDDGGWELGALAAARGTLWVDRPYYTGNPDPLSLAPIVQASVNEGAWVQIGNEPNNPIEGWQGGIGAYLSFFATMEQLVSGGKLITAPPSPGFANWQDWVNVTARNIGVHCYGSNVQMQQIVQWYLDHTTGDLWITECNPGAGNIFNLNQWARNDLAAFLNWCATKARIKFVSYFAWTWDQSPTLPVSIDAKGTDVIPTLINFAEEQMATKTVTLSAAQVASLENDLNVLWGIVTNVLAPIGSTTQSGYVASLVSQGQNAVSDIKNTLSLT